MADTQVPVTPEMLGQVLPEIKKRLAGAQDKPGLTDLTKRRYWSFYRDDVAVLLEAVERGIKPKCPPPPAKEEKKMETVGSEK